MENTLEALLATEFAEEAYRLDLESLLGVRSDREIGELIEGLVARELAQRVECYRFATKSVGAVFGLELESTERVVLKLFHRSQLLAELRAADRLHELVCSSGYPAPARRSGLFHATQGLYGCFYAHVDGELRDAHEPLVRRELARSLAELAELLRGKSVEDLPPAPTRLTGLWPDSHRSFIVLEESPETRFVDDVARRAQAVVRASSLGLIPAHLDWGIKNTRFRGERIAVVYDWDSLFAASEAEMVGRAAAQFAAQWETASPPTVTSDEACAFVAEYEAFRGHAFEHEERAVVTASAEYLIAQIARLEVGSGALEGAFLELLRSLDSRQYIP